MMNIYKCIHVQTTDLCTKESARKQGWAMLVERISEVSQHSANMVQELEKQVNSHRNEVQNDMQHLLTNFKKNIEIESSKHAPNMKDGDENTTTATPVKRKNEGRQQQPPSELIKKEEEFENVMMMKKKSFESEIELVIHRMMDPMLDPLHRKINNGLHDVVESIHQEIKLKDDNDSKFKREVRSVLSQLQDKLQHHEGSLNKIISNSKSESAPSSYNALKNFKSEEEMSKYIEFYILAMKRKLEKELNMKMEQNIKSAVAPLTSSVKLCCYITYVSVIYNMSP
jgi:hypothetical protein